MSGDVRLVRHTDVALAWRGRCYGASDMGLSRQGRAALVALAQTLADDRPEWVMHSGMTRTRLLAERVAMLTGCPILSDPDWRERGFGAWEGQRWTAIYRATGNAMDGMIDAPGVFRPGGGETTHELADRAMGAWRRLPVGRGIIVTHGGPIAALIGQMRGEPVDCWPNLVPLYGGSMILSR